MNRRAFIAGLGSAAAWPMVAGAQQHPPMGVPSSGVSYPVIGIIHDVLAAEYGFRRGLAEVGFFEGVNVAIDYRSAGQFDRLPVMAADLVSRSRSSSQLIATSRLGRR